MLKSKIIGILSIVIGFISLVSVTFIGLNLSGSVSILKNDISVSSNTYTKEYNGYGIDDDAYTLSSGSLYDGDHLDVTFLSTGEDVGTYDSVFDVRVLNKNNRDVSEKYNIAKYYGTVTITQRSVGLYVETIKEEYNGEELKATDCKIVDGSIVEGQEFKPVISGSIIDIGSTPVKIDPRVYSGDKDVTANYKFSANNAELIKTKIDLIIKSSTLDRPYNGEELKANPDEEPFEVTGSLAKGDRLVYSNLPSITNVGAVLNTFDVKVLNAKDEDVTENYNIRTEYGYLNITAMTVKYTSKTYDYLYSGEYVDQKDEELELESNVAPTDEYIVTFTGSYKNCGEFDNKFNVIIRNKDTHENVSKNYNIDISFGKLTVKKRDIILATKSFMKIYDGNINTGWTDLKGDPVSSTDQYELLYDNMLASDYIDVSFAGTSKNAGDFKNNVVVRVYDENDTLITNNYNITLELGTLSIKPRKITLMASSAEKAFDGTPLIAKDWYLVNGSTITGEKLAVEVGGSQTQVGTSSNRIIGWKIFDEYDNEITNGANNYDITTYEGSLWVYQQTETVTLAPKDISMSLAEFTLKGLTALTPSSIVGFDDYEALGYELKMDSVEFSGSLSNCGTAVSEIINPENIRIYYNEQDVSGRFDITVKPGKLQIYSLDIEIPSKSQSFEYDGTNHTLPEIDANSVVVRGVSDYEVYENVDDSISIVIGTDIIRITFTFSGEITNVGAQLNAFTVQTITLNGNLDNKISEYRVHTKPGTLVVTKKVLYVHTANGITEKGTENFSKSDISDQSIDGLMAGDHAYVKKPFEYSSNYAVTVENKLVIGVLDSLGNDVSDNYIIIYSYGVLTFTN